MQKSNIMTDELRINSAARYHCTPDWSLDTSVRGMPDRDLWVVLAGTGSARLAPEAERPVARGDVFVLDETRPFAAGHNASDPLTVVAVHFDGGPALPAHVQVVPIEFLAGILDRLLRCRLAGDEAAARRWLHAALEEVAAAAGAREHGRDARAAHAVAGITDQIRERPGDDWRVATLAERAGVSPQHLGRLFRELTGRAPKEYVLEARVEAAKAYLRGSSLPLKRIAAELGFHDEFHFSRRFSQRVGASPSAYRSRAGAHPPRG
ncbi:MAG: helix-turn-helix domain-containing protein [Spirochaetota bacterium]